MELPVLLLALLALQTPVDWPAYGHDPQGTRYSPAAAIDRGNVARLAPAWTYRTGGPGGAVKTPKPTAFEATPLVVEGVMYVGTPLGRVIALDPATGRERWVFDPAIKRDVTYGDFASRGVAAWVDEAAPTGTGCRRRIFVATAQSQLIALDARDGRPCAGFGRSGIVDLKAGLRIAPFEPGAYSMTSPPLVVNGAVITGSSIADNSRPDPASGEVRAYDARTGALKWTWDPIPQDSGDPAYGEWGGALAHKTGAANAWSVLAADPAHDLVFIPTGSAAPDYYGVLRLGRNRYANSIVALHASTGKLVWAFQTVHHDLWDYDNASPPALVTVTHDGASVPAVLQATNTGGAYWGGVAVDPVRQIAVVPVNRIAAVVQLIPREGFHHDQAMAEDKRLGRDYEYNSMWGTPYVMRRRILLSPSGMPCTPPPFGTLVAIDLKTGRRLWEVPIGSFTRPLEPGQAAKVPAEWGSTNLGGPIVTAGGVLFFGAAPHRPLHASDIETGREPWRGPPAPSGQATPLTHQLASGEQFVAIAVGGGGAFGAGDYVVAFRLAAERRIR